MVSSSNKLKLNNTGQALVEFALILPFLLFLTFAIIEFGRYLYIKNAATNGARQGARVAAVTPLDWTPTRKSAIYHAATSIKAGSGAWNTPVIAPDPPSTSGVAITVTVSKPFTMMPFLTYFVPTLTSVSASATMRYE